MKRLLDIVCSLIGLLLLLPIFLLITLLIYIDDPGSIFYQQKRIGKNGQVFKIIKFRSMKADADKVGPYFTTENDLRITTVGRILRRTSLDELPQLLNVLLGEMSLVGPRPNVEQQRELYTKEEWKVRNSVQPGITGLAQATLRSNASEKERTALDLEYVSKSSFIFDLKIILLTIKQVILKGGN